MTMTTTTMTSFFYATTNLVGCIPGRGGVGDFYDDDEDEDDDDGDDNQDNFDEDDEDDHNNDDDDNDDLVFCATTNLGRMHSWQRVDG
jgi:hypothetical protein